MNGTQPYFFRTWNALSTGLMSGYGYGQSNTFHPAAVIGDVTDNCSYVFFTSLTKVDNGNCQKRSSTAAFLGWPIWCLVVSTPVVSFFFSTFHIAVLAMQISCAMSHSVSANKRSPWQPTMAKKLRQPISWSTTLLIRPRSPIQLVVNNNRLY